jgi:lysozyme
MTRPVPQLALDFLQRAESCRLNAYQDSVGVWTIGYGHTGVEVKEGLAISNRRARAWLMADASEAAEQLAKQLDPSVLAELSDHQYAALISFTYNLGARPNWTIWKVVNARAFEQTPAQIVRFDKVRTASGAPKTLPGLTHRRAAEVALWNTPDIAAAAAVATACGAPPPPSSETRTAETPPAPTAEKPLTHSRSFGAAAATAATAIPVAIQGAREGAAAISQAVAPYADQSNLLHNAMAGLAVVCATLAALTVVMQWLKHRRALRA